MRIVAGELRGRHLLAPPGFGTRPTTDRVREAVFNSLGHLAVLDGAHVVDAFAGSGALGLEALSRGAAHVTFIERDPCALRALRANVEALGVAARVTVVAADASRTLRAAGAADIVFADPPYAFDRWDELIEASPAPLLVAESGSPVDPPRGWETVRTKRYGRTAVTFLRRCAADRAGD